jgi:lipoyl(octanoyl) transferase
MMIENIENTVIVRLLGQQDYLACWQAMKNFTDHRSAETADEIWLLEHPAVFTQGQSGKAEHILNPGTIPVIPIDRGGQVTYHGPGQLVAYTLVDIKRKKINIRELVTSLEQAVIALLADNDIPAAAKREAPGVYVGNKKICSIGLRIRRGCAYHGLALNVDMDLTPFTCINPCGFPQLQMTQLAEMKGPQAFTDIARALSKCLAIELGYTNRLIKTEPHDGS